jgi:hypothetical protein
MITLQKITIGMVVSFDHDEFLIDGKVKAIEEHMIGIDYWEKDCLRRIWLPSDAVRIADQGVNDWIEPRDLGKRVLGDSIDDQDFATGERLTDALGRGLKGKGHGSIDWKKVERKRKSGKTWTTYQPWYQWEDERGKHCRYLRKGVDLEVQRLLDEGATVEMILESIGKSKSKSKGKTR